MFKYSLASLDAVKLIGDRALSSSLSIPLNIEELSSFFPCTRGVSMCLFRQLQVNNLYKSFTHNFLTLNTLFFSK